MWQNQPPLCISNLLSFGSFVNSFSIVERATVFRLLQKEFFQSLFHQAVFGFCWQWELTSVVLQSTTIKSFFSLSLNSFKFKIPVHKLEKLYREDRFIQLFKKKKKKRFDFHWELTTCHANLSPLFLSSFDFTNSESRMVRAFHFHHVYIFGSRFIDFPDVGRDKKFWGYIQRNQVLLLISKELGGGGRSGLGFAFLSAPFPASPPPSLNTHRDFHNLGRRSNTLL